MRISLYSVLIVAKNSLLLLVSKSSTRLVIYRMNPGVVPNAVEQGKQSVTEILGTDHNVRCSRWYAPIVVKTPKYRSNPAKTGRSIAVTATKRPE